MKPTLRFTLGLAFLALSLILPLFGLLVVRLPLSLASKATIIALLTVGGPELLGIMAVVCLGPENLLRLKQKLMARLRRLRPPSPVSRTRCRVGAGPGCCCSEKFLESVAQAFQPVPRKRVNLHSLERLCHQPIPGFHVLYQVAVKQVIFRIVGAVREPPLQRFFIIYGWGTGP
jgi:hypothetical protein